jgi:hypothetical protein
MKKLGILFSFMSIIAMATAFKQPANDRNLKILPKDITDAKLDSIMHTYTKALGVTCEFCHVKKQGFKDSLDYASDAEPMKEEARRMMRLTIELNTKYFYFDSTKRPEYLNTVTCNTCHRGEPFPPED